MSSICWLYQNWWVSRLKEKLFLIFWIFLLYDLTGIYFYLIFFFYLDSTAPDDKDFLHRSILRTDHFQASLPRLPVPELEDTLKKYLESQRQILTDAEYDQTVDIVNKFKATDGPGTIVC